MSERSPAMRFPVFHHHVMDGDEVIPEMSPEICAVHGDTVDLIKLARNDLQWIKWIGYGLLVSAASLTVSIWSVFYPYLTNINGQLGNLHAAVGIMQQRIMILEKTDEESKSDRKEIRQYIEHLRRSAGGP